MIWKKKVWQGAVAPGYKRCVLAIWPKGLVAIAHAQFGGVMTGLSTTTQGFQKLLACNLFFHISIVSTGKKAIKVILKNEKDVDAWKKVTLRRSMHFSVSYCMLSSKTAQSSQVLIHVDVTYFLYVFSVSLLYLTFIWRPCFATPHKLYSALFFFLANNVAGACSRSIKLNGQQCGEHEQTFGECLQFLQETCGLLGGFCQADKIK